MNTPDSYQIKDANIQGRLIVSHPESGKNYKLDAIDTEINVIESELIEFDPEKEHPILDYFRVQTSFLNEMLRQIDVEMTEGNVKKFAYLLAIVCQYRLIDGRIEWGDHDTRAKTKNAKFRIEKNFPKYAEALGIEKSLFTLADRFIETRFQVESVLNQIAGE